MTTTRQIIPSRLLCDPDPARRLPYTPAIRQDQEGLLARWNWERGPDNPSNYHNQQVEQS